MKKNSKIFVAGHNGMVGSAIVRLLKKEGYDNLLLRGKKDLDLTNQSKVYNFFNTEKPDYVFLSAALVGGIGANMNSKADFFYINSMIQNNVIHQSYINNVKKLVFLGSSCIYPKSAKSPINESQLLSGKLEETNEGYSIAKISGIKMCQFYKDQYGCNFISVMPTNLYGPNDNYDLHNSHLIAALLRKFFEAKNKNFNQIEIWGDGTPIREVMHVDDCASACLFLMLNYDGFSHVNIGTGEEYSVKQLVDIFIDKFRFNGAISFNSNYPNGMKRKKLDISLLRDMGWKHSVSFTSGIEDMIIRLPDELENFINQ
ncbi:MAG: GDP-fucose synthetase [Flavobacteriales bacterium]|nr:GDP-fucose synthetase [Flavobacteriales bacterium]|tara:strand:- start:263 stop:1207 length:945 start_codon:yes stop_codon:yes gene_type:complete